jgi:hypothetical protein
MMIGRGNRSTRRKPAPVPLCPPQTPYASPDAKPSRGGGKPATNRLSYGTYMWKYFKMGLDWYLFSTRFKITLYFWTWLDSHSNEINISMAVA